MVQKITSIQCIMLIMSSITPTFILTVPSIVVESSGQDAWLSILLAIAAAVLIAWLIGAICSMNPGMLLIDWLDSRLGRLAGSLFGLILAFYYFTNETIIIRQFINFMSENVLTRTPAYAIITVALLVMLYSANHGIEVIARINMIISLITFLTILVTIILLLNKVQLPFLLPIGEHSIRSIIHGSIPPTAWLSEVAILLVLLPYLKHPEHASLIGIWSVIASGIELLLFVVAAIVIFGPELITILAYPTFNMVGILKLGNLMERIDVLFISLWISTMYIKMSIFMFCSWHCFVHSCRIKNTRPFLPAIGLLTALYTLWSWPKTTETNHFNRFSLSPDLLTFNVVIPLLIWLCCLAAGIRAPRAKGR
ncbi:hypothetical protein DVH26_06310 [Paenibacillus sp. H1-7]|uniref:GerAB/ArcD/ProY family transporter n=1 Tax=Paenibacillus sp. H1-7 TaxID=2282849 RepID=UPI001EF83F09|nr:endospore germination permease [Paenibacillus sp. H1-7]ULL14090.1 hypothetical protein DVH26_06310 [Paenibacillus sp. H1-7]